MHIGTRSVVQRKLVSQKIQAKDLTHDIILSGQEPHGYGDESDVFCGTWVLNGRLKGEDSKLVAVKLLRPRIQNEADGDPVRLRERLDHEAGTLMFLDHPNIIKVHGCWYGMGGRPGIVTQWYKNGTVTAYAQKQPVAYKLRLVNEVSVAMQYLHEQELPIIHGDLKGANILVDDNGHVVLTGFGLSTYLGEDSSAKPSSKWIAPELLINPDQPRSLASDVWSFGCTSLEILTDHAPYQRYTGVAALAAIVQGKNPASVNDMALIELIGLSPLLGQCWELDPRKRPNMAEVTSRLSVISCT